MNNNNLIRLLIFVAVMAMLISVTSTVLGYELLPVNITAEEVYVGSADTVLSVEASEGDTIAWYKEVYGVSKGADKIKGATGTSYTLTEEDTSAEGLLIFYATVNGVRSELIKITVKKPVHEITVDPIIFTFEDNEHIESVTASEYSFEEVDGKTVLKVVNNSDSADVNVKLKGFDVPVNTHKVAVYKVMHMADERGRRILLYPGYNGIQGHFVDDSGAPIAKLLGYTGAKNEWQYLIDEDLGKANYSGNTSEAKKDGNYLGTIETFYGGRFDYYNDSPAKGSYMYLEYIAFFATKEDANEYIRRDKGVAVAEQPDDLDMVAWEFKNDPAFAATFLPDTVVTDGANLKAGVKTTTSLMSRNKFDIDRYSVVKVLGATEGTITFYDGETELGAIDLSEGNIADFTDREAFPNWKGEFTDFRIEASVGMTVEAIAFFVNEANANLYTAKAYPCSECGEIPCICSSKPLKYEDAIWWNFADTWTLNSVQPINANGTYCAKTEEEIAHVSYTVTSEVEEVGYFALRYNSVNMKSDHRLTTQEYPFIKLGYKYSGTLADTQAYIKFSTDRSENVTVNFGLTATDVDMNGYCVIALDFSSLTSLKAIDASVNDEFRGEIESFEFGIKNGKANETLDMAYIVFFEDSAQCSSFDGVVMVPPPLNPSPDVSPEEGTPCGENAVFTPLTVDGVMYIKGTGDMTNWECDLDVPWYDMRDKISKVVIEEGITSVGDYAFDFCKALTSVELPDGITYIGDYAFDFCINLKEITLPYGVKTIGESAFEYCRSLTELVVPQSVDAVKDYAFNDCRKLKTVYYAGDETAFNSVNIGKENDALTDADFVYSSNGPVPAVLSVDKSAVILHEGEKVTLTATLDSDISDDVIWFSDNEKIATVENGVVTAKRAGEVTITAVAENNRSTKANCLIKVEHLYGDTTLDGSINVSDAILLLQHLASSNIILGPKD